MKRNLVTTLGILLMASLAFLLVACDTNDSPVTADSASPSKVAPPTKGERSPTVMAAMPNLRVEGITYTCALGSDGKYSVTFYCTVANRGTATARSFVLGGRGWGTPTIATPTGTWQAINTTYDLPAGATRTMVIYGPGYVGPRVSKGTSVTLYAYADVYAVIAESSEWDNSYSRTIRAGY